jgi:hypothetical protein
MESHLSQTSEEETSVWPPPSSCMAHHTSPPLAPCAHAARPGLGLGEPGAGVGALLGGARRPGVAGHVVAPPSRDGAAAVARVLR